MRNGDSEIEASTVGFLKAVFWELLAKCMMRATQDPDNQQA
jgi:hypothetical protein